MLKKSITRKELEMRRSALYADLYQCAAHMDLHSMENLCRRINVIALKIYAFKGNIYDKDK
ncbi:MAG: hypothetical protein K6A96_10930 [Prevotella sp.]|nr:hypothetical protein [Prevotella sp.]